MGFEQCLIGFLILTMIGISSSSSLSNENNNINPSWGVKIEEGDLILFSRKCSSMDFLSASICFGAKIGTISEWDHVGLVIKSQRKQGNEGKEGKEGEEEEILEILEANLGGITRRPLKKRLLQTRANKIGIRKIYGRKSKDFNQKLNEIVSSYVDKGYNSSFIDMTKAWYNSYYGQSNFTHSSSFVLVLVFINISSSSTTC